VTAADIISHIRLVIGMSIGFKTLSSAPVFLKARRSV